MNLKVKAGVIVAGMLGIGITAILAIKLAITYISPDAAPAVGMGIIMCGLLYLMYIMVLDRLKYEAKLSELVDRNLKS